MKKPRGGARPNSGRKVGSKLVKTLKKEEARALLREIVMAEMRELVAAQMDNAKGLAHFMLRDKATGKFERVTNPKLIEAALNDPDATEGSAYWIYTKDPSTQAFTDLMNRTIGKPVEQVEVGKPGDFSQLSNEELNARLVAMHLRLGAVVVKLLP